MTGGRARSSITKGDGGRASNPLARPPEVGAVLRRTRLRRGLSLQAAARLAMPQADVTSIAQRILRLERSRRVDVALLWRLARAYGLPPASFVAVSPLERALIVCIDRLPTRQQVRLLGVLRRGLLPGIRPNGHLRIALNRPLRNAK